jgi:hypothetical protein
MTALPEWIPLSSKYALSIARTLFVHDIIDVGARCGRLATVSAKIAGGICVRIVCAWCAEEGKPAVIGEKEPLDDPDETTGVCTEHKRQLKRAAEPGAKGALDKEDDAAAEAD